VIQEEHRSLVPEHSAQTEPQFWQEVPAKYFLLAQVAQTVGPALEQVKQDESHATQVPLNKSFGLSQAVHAEGPAPLQVLQEPSHG